MPNNNDNYEYMKFLDLTGVEQIWNTCKQTFVQTVNGVGIDANGNVQLNTESLIDLSNYIQKSNTSGLIKNNGTIDTNSYITAALDNWTSLYQSNNFEVEYSRFKNGRYILHIHLNQVNISIIGNLITSIPGQHSFLKPSKTLRTVIGADFQNASGRVSCGLDLDTTGTIYAYPHLQTQMGGSVALTLYGDAYFIIY